MPPVAESRSGGRCVTLRAWHCGRPPGAHADDAATGLGPPWMPHGRGTGCSSADRRPRVPRPGSPCHSRRWVGRPSRIRRRRLLRGRRRPDPRGAPLSRFPAPPSARDRRPPVALCGHRRGDRRRDRVRPGPARVHGARGPQRRPRHARCGPIRSACRPCSAGCCTPSGSRPRAWSGRPTCSDPQTTLLLIAILLIWSRRRSDPHPTSAGGRGRPRAGDGDPGLGGPARWSSSSWMIALDGPRRRNGSMVARRSGCLPVRRPGSPPSACRSSWRRRPRSSGTSSSTSSPGPSLGITVVDRLRALEGFPIGTTGAHRPC